MWFDGKRQPNTLYVASISRGKDSTAMLRAIALLGFPLDAIVSVDIWFDEDTPAELPPMVAFKDEYDQKVLEMFGVPVTRVCATKRDRERREDEDCHPRLSYCEMFYTRYTNSRYGRNGRIYGFPHTGGGWCKRLKIENVDIQRHLLPPVEGEGENIWVSDSPGKLVYRGTESASDDEEQPSSEDIRVF